MSKDQKGFIVFGDNEPIFNKLTDEEAGQLLKGMVKYFNYGIEPDFNDKLDMAWVTVKLQMDRNAEKYEKRCEKNRENVKKRYERIRSNTNEYDGIQSNTNATNRDRDRDRKKDRDKDKESVPDASSLSSFLIDHLNEKTGSNYTTSEAVIRQIDSLLASGYTANQMRTVIDKKCAEWMGDEKMRGYLRPSTLFGDKFGEYLAAPISIALERERETNRKRSELSRQLEEKRQALSVLNEALPDAEPTERRSLREQIAILEDSIGVIERRLA